MLGKWMGHYVRLITKGSSQRLCSLLPLKTDGNETGYHMPAPYIPTVYMPLEASPLHAYFLNAYLLHADALRAYLLYAYLMQERGSVSIFHFSKPGGRKQIASR